MDPLTIGIAIAGAKKLVETCSDIKDLSGSLEHLFSASEAKPKKKISHNQQVLRRPRLIRLKLLNVKRS